MTIKTAIDQLLEVEQAKGESGNDNYFFSCAQVLTFDLGKNNQLIVEC